MQRGHISAPVQLSIDGRFLVIGIEYQVFLIPESYTEAIN
jgi:hypothetical protein